MFSISPLNSFSSLVISHHPPFPYFLLSFIHEGTEVYPFYSIYRLGSAVILARSLIDQFSSSLLPSLADIHRERVALDDRARRALSVRLSTLHAWSPTPPPPPFVRIPLTWCGQSESRGKGINRHSSESEYALKRYTPESKLSEEEGEEEDRIYVILGKRKWNEPLARRSIDVHRDNGLPCAI